MSKNREIDKNPSLERYTLCATLSQPLVQTIYQLMGTQPAPQIQQPPLLQPMTVPYIELIENLSMAELTVLKARLPETACTFEINTTRFIERQGRICIVNAVHSDELAQLIHQHHPTKTTRKNSQLKYPRLILGWVAPKQHADFKARLINALPVGPHKIHGLGVINAAGMFHHLRLYALETHADLDWLTLQEAEQNEQLVWGIQTLKRGEQAIRMALMGKARCGKLLLDTCRDLFAFAPKVKSPK